MSFEFFETLKPKPIFQKEIILKGAGKNNTIKAKLAKNVVKNWTSSTEMGCGCRRYSRFLITWP